MGKRSKLSVVGDGSQEHESLVVSPGLPQKTESADASIHKTPDGHSVEPVLSPPPPQAWNGSPSHSFATDQQRSDVPNSAPGEDLSQEGRGTLQQDAEDQDQQSGSIEPDTESDDCDEDVGEALSFPVAYSALSGLLLTSGTKRLSRVDYNVCKTFTNYNANGKGSKLPSSSTIQKKIHPLAGQVCFVPSKVSPFAVDLNKSGAKGGVARYASTSTAPVEIVLPSEWAKIDLSTDICSELFTQPSGRRMETMFSDVEGSPIVMDRELFLSPFSMRTASMKRGILRKGVRLCVSFSMNKLSETDVSVMRQLGYNQVPVSQDIVETMVVRAVCLYSSEVSAVNTLACENTTALSARSGNAEPGDIVIYVRCNGGGEKFIVFKHVSTENRVCLLIVKGKRVIRVRTSVSLEEEQNIPDFFVPRRATAPRQGRLEDGTKYFVYRFLLYSDGFTPTLGNKGSVCGCYILPLGIPIEKRTIGGSVRRIALTPPGVSPRAVLEKVVEDITNGVTEGFLVKTLNGDSVRIFLDAVGNTGDYPGISEVIDVLGHNSNAPCTICSFIRRPGETSSRYCYSHEISSGHLSFRRTGYRTTELRNSNYFHDDDFKTVGLKPNSRIHGVTQPLHHLMTTLREVREEIPKTSCGRPVVPGHFDPYLSNFIAPVHLFTGLGKYSIDAVVVLLNPRERSFLNSLMVVILSENGMSKV